jgi:hypothetical protein
MYLSLGEGTSGIVRGNPATEIKGSLIVAQPNRNVKHMF